MDVDKKIRVRVVDAFTIFNHDKSIVLSDVEDGEEFTALLEGSEYFAKDREGREFLVGTIGINGFEIDDCLELITKNES